MEIPYGFCHCNCGQPTKISTRTDASTDRIKGVPMKFIRGHNGPRTHAGPEYLVEDHGYKTPCWIWQHGLDKYGYGVTNKKTGGVPQRAHRVVYEREKGPIPEGLDLDHLCRVHACVNPDHTEPVTKAVNTQRGSLAKLTPEMVAEIRQLKASGKRTCEIVKLFPVSYAVIRNVCNGVAWRNV
jgi:hypothetical protein